VRKTPARNAHVPTAMTPPRTDVGLTHEVITSPYPSVGHTPRGDCARHRAQEERGNQGRARDTRM
jgi:hypothetical protein